ncbi:MAG: hypothetical protein ACREMK_12515, partial [Gemmatimonadota bacterium]
RVVEAGANVLGPELGEIREDLLLDHASGEIGEHITDRDASAANDRLPEADLGVDDDALTVINQRGRSARPVEFLPKRLPEDRGCRVLAVGLKPPLSEKAAA